MQSLSKLNAEELRRKIAGGSKNAEDYGNLGYVLFARGHSEEAISFYEQALNLASQNFQKAELSVELGWLFYEVGRRTQAQTLAENAITLLSNQGDTKEVLTCRGGSHALIAYCVSFRDQNAGVDAARTGLELLERVIDENPDFGEIAAIYHWAARLHILLEDKEKAVILSQRCLQHAMEERARLDCLITLAEALRSQERFAEAEHAIEEASRSVGTDKRYAEADKRVALRLQRELGLIQRSSNHLTEARNTFHQLLVLVQADPSLCKDPHILGDVYWNLAIVLFESSEYQEAAAAYEEALVFFPQDEQNHYTIMLSLGDCYSGTADYDKARTCYQKVLALPYTSNAMTLNARAGLAKISYELKEYAKAAAVFQEILPHYDNDDPNYSNISLVLGYCFEAMGAAAKARDCYEKILASRCAWEADTASARESLRRLPPSSKGTYH